MSEWWNMHDGAVVGAIAGSALGVLGGAIGVLAGIGVLRGVVLASMKVCVAAGVAALAVGLFAVMRGQPYHVWYPLVLCGGILTLVMGFLLPVVSLRFRQAEARKMDAEEIRRG